MTEKIPESEIYITYDDMADPNEVTFTRRQMAAALFMELETLDRGGSPITTPEDYLLDTYRNGMVVYRAAIKPPIITDEAGVVVGATRVKHSQPFESGLYTVIDQIAVSDPFRNRGIGTILMKAIVKGAIERGDSMLALVSSPGETSLFFRRFGFLTAPVEYAPLRMLGYRDIAAESLNLE